MDYQRVCELDPTLSNTVKKELKLLNEAVKKQDAEDKQKLAGKLFTQPFVLTTFHEVNLVINAMIVVMLQ